MHWWSLISFSSTLMQPSIEWVTVVTYSNWNLFVREQCAVHLYRVPLRQYAESRIVGPASEYIPISSVSQESRLGPLLFILYTSEMFELVENKLFASDDSTLLAVVRKPADRPAVSAFFNRDLARIQNWCNHWCMTTGSWQTKALVVSRSRTVSPPHGDLVLPGVFIRANLNLDILSVKFDRKLTPEAYVRGIVSRVSKTIGILRLVKRIFVETSVLYFVTILYLFSQSFSIFLLFGGLLLNITLIQLLEREVYSVVRLCPDQSFLQLCHWRRVAGLSMLYKVNSNSSTVCLASFRLLLLYFDILELRPQLIHLSLMYQGV